MRNSYQTLNRCSVTSIAGNRTMHKSFTHRPRLAYFSMEIALRNEIPTYSGGLGVLAGDTIRAAADLDLPLVAVSLVSRNGYFLPENDAADRELTHYLYGGDATYRLKQEIVLGIGGVRMLNALGFSVRQYHMNEGHSALLTLELLYRHAYSAKDVRPGELPYDVPQVRALCNFTTHTPVEAGHDQFPYDLVQHVLGDFIELTTLKSFAGQERLNMTHLALNLSDYVNGVAKRHTEVSQKMFPGYRKQVGKERDHGKRSRMQHVGGKLMQ